ncbi:hypothetical protein RchiOBHm_Chr6g0295801 [Rosa chinensis]|uniref:Uncharacterized protein n=1 Tax=Rosa chinensis TaxID=74649 RepID=A0A2P6PX85_ROSCH|nr:hypothetical protein RchiOBHm_Chr6g0295801 [Rosa chinensis]
MQMRTKLCLFYIAGAGIIYSLAIRWCPQPFAPSGVDLPLRVCFFDLQEDRVRERERGGEREKTKGICCSFCFFCLCKSRQTESVLSFVDSKWKLFDDDADYSLASKIVGVLAKWVFLGFCFLLGNQYSFSAIRTICKF